MFRAVMAGALLALSASHAGAQITTYVAPPRPAAADPAVVAAADSARKDSVARVAMTNMAEWVDSASGVAVPGAVGDTLAANDPGRPVTTTFSEGAVAPATASDLPMLAAAGALLLVVGAALVANRSRG
jgi:hypothetical protein